METKVNEKATSILKSGRVIFNIKGNDYRLVARIQYQEGVLAIRFFGHSCPIRQHRRGDRVMDAKLILIDSAAELARAHALVDRLWDSDDPADVARLAGQARLIAACEESQWPRRSPSTAELIRHLMEQHAVTRADMVPILGTPSRLSEVLALSIAMVQRLRAL